AINLTNQRRALPIAFVATCGNMAQLSQAAIALALLEDPRITAIGLHIEGFADLRGWERLAQKAHERGVPVVVLKVGASELAQAATVSHTASLAGSDAGVQALMDRVGFARVHDLSVFLETLKLLHMTGPLASSQIASISCSGGEASLIADMAQAVGLTFPPLGEHQKHALAEVLGPMVALANPLDYHTYIWRDADAMARAWAAMMDPGVGLTVSIVDYPHENRQDWECATQAAIRAHATAGRPMAVVASLPELMPADVAHDLAAGDVVPMFGLCDSVAAVAAAASIRAPDARALALPGDARPCEVLEEDVAKSHLAVFGVDVPNGVTVQAADDFLSLTASLRGPLALKGLGLAHKTDAGAV
ncbi:MAG: CoA-binding protein, partial [Roseobacter sp.]